MLALTEPGPSRREFLRAGGLTLGGLSLSQLLEARSLKNAPVTGRSVIFLFMHGGPSQVETFDPKMTAPAGIRSVTGEIPTTLPGVTFGGTFPKLARLAHKMAVVRSFVTGSGSHDIKPIVCGDTLGANMGSLYSRMAGLNHPVTGMPTNAALFPRAVDPRAGERTSKFGNFLSTGSLPRAFAPFAPGSGAGLQEDMKLTISRDRLDDRRGLLALLDEARRAADRSEAREGVDRFRSQAFDVILGGISDAFDLSKEDPRVVERYDTAGLISADRVSRSWNNWRKYVDHIRSLGKLLLMARRLCEAGCGFVTVTTNFVWDMHADKNNATIEEGLRYVGAPFDHAVSTFIEDLEARGLSDRIMLVACGEMGRNPKVNIARNSLCCCPGTGDGRPASCY